VSVDGDVLKGYAGLSFVRNEGENVFPEGAEDGLPILSYQGDSWVARKG